MKNSTKILKELEIEGLLDESKKEDHAVNEKLTTEDIIKPVLEDLESLHDIVQRTNRTTVLEFGVGWSTAVFAASLEKLRKEIGNLDAYRRNNPFECHSVDNQSKYIDIAMLRLKDSQKGYVHFHQSRISMTKWNGRFATEYETLPLVNPDLIYIDAPDQFTVEGDINGWSTRHKDLMPMVCDVLKIEHFLTPKTIIVLDGRGANARFMKSNLQRNWQYKYDHDRDQHFFVLEEEPLGKFSKMIIEDLYYKKGKWTVTDL